MINNFDRIAPNESALRPVIVDGKSLDLCTIGKFDKRNNTDDSSRAEYRSTVIYEENNTYNYGFNLLIPDSWCIDNVNEHDWIYYKGITLIDGDRNPYWKAGLYIGDWNNQHTVNHRKLLIQL